MENAVCLQLPKFLPMKRGNYISWDTGVKKFIANGGDPNLLNFHIPKSDLYRWRKLPSDYFLNLDSCDENFKRVVRFVRNDAIMYYHKISCQVILIYKTILFSFKNGKKLFNDAKEFIVQKIDEFKEQISLRNAVELFGISEYIYFTWKTGKICLESAFGVCVKRWPNQILNEEVREIKKYISKDEYKHWSYISVYYQGKRDGAFAFDDSTFYKHLHLLGIEKNIT